MPFTATHGAKRPRQPLTSLVFVPFKLDRRSQLAAFEREPIQVIVAVRRPRALNMLKASIFHHAPQFAIPAPPPVLPNLPGAGVDGELVPVPALAFLKADKIVGAVKPLLEFARDGVSVVAQHDASPYFPNISRIFEEGILEAREA
jgi:hypothetical protein